MFLIISRLIQWVTYLPFLCNSFSIHYWVFFFPVYGGLMKFFCFVTLLNFIKLHISTFLFLSHFTFQFPLVNRTEANSSALNIGVCFRFCTLSYVIVLLLGLLLCVLPVVDLRTLWRWGLKVPAHIKKIPDPSWPHKMADTRLPTTPPLLGM